MSLLENLNDQLKDAMKSKDKIKLDALRAIKSAILISKTSSGPEKILSLEDEIKILQKLVKQRKESAEIFKNQNRIDLSNPEYAQADVISTFLPDQLSDEEIDSIISEIINEIDAKDMSDMGKVMGIASKKMSGKADGKKISTIVKQKLSNKQ